MSQEGGASASPSPMPALTPTAALTPTVAPVRTPSEPVRQQSSDLQADAEKSPAHSIGALDRSPHVAPVIPAAAKLPAAKPDNSPKAASPVSAPARQPAAAQAAAPAAAKVETKTSNSGAFLL